MRLLATTAAAALLAAFPAMAQQAVPSYQGMPPDGARPGHAPGQGVSYPLSGKASNIDSADTRSAIAPTLPSPQLGPNAGPADYLRAARNSLAAGRTGEAQQSLEMAQTRLLDRSVAYDATGKPITDPAVTRIGDALRALAAGDRTRTMQIIESAMPVVAAEAPAR